MSKSTPSSNDDLRRQGGVEMMAADNWSVRDKGFWSPEIEDYRDRVEREFMKFSRAPQERLSWLTIIADPVVVEPGDHGDVVIQRLRDTQRKLIARSRRSMPGMKIRGVFELDVLAASACRIGRHKADLLRALGVDVATVASNHRILVPHLHCIVDRADHTPERLAEQMKAEFPGPWRTLAKPFHADRSLRSNLETLAGYCTKMKVAYSDAWAGRTTKYAEVYEPAWVETLHSTLNSIGLDDLYFSHRGGRLPASDLSITAVAKNGRNPGPSGSSTGNEIAAARCTSLVENVCGDAPKKLNAIDAKRLRYRAKLHDLQRSLPALDFADMTLRFPDRGCQIDLAYPAFQPDFLENPDHLAVLFGIDGACHGTCAMRTGPISLRGIFEGGDDALLCGFCGDRFRCRRRICMGSCSAERAGRGRRPSRKRSLRGPS